MRLGVIPEGIIDLIALLSGRMPLPVVKSFWGYAMGRTVLAGVRLGVFDALDSGPKSASEVARIIKTDPDATETLLNALNGFGLIKRKKGRYSLTTAARKWLTQNSATTMKDSVLFIGEVCREFERLEDVVRSGRPPHFHDLKRPEEFWNSYLRGLGTFARFGSREIVRKVRFDRPPQRMLDVGGGHGVYTIEFLKRYPSLTAVILDLPPAIEVGRKMIVEAGLSDRIRFRAQDMRVGDWGSGYDLVLLFNVIHAVPIDDAEGLIENAYQALNESGRLVILDSEHTGGDKDLSLTSGLNELLFFVINGTRAYPEARVREWLTKSGFRRVTKKHLLVMPMAMLLIADK